jgi:hypothetical protein
MSRRSSDHASALVMKEAGAELSPEEIDAVRRDGQALYGRCCRGRADLAAHRFGPAGPPKTGAAAHGYGRIARLQ